MENGIGKDDVREDDDNRLTLSNLLGGAASELFDLELKKIISDIQDMSKKTKDPRKIVLEVVFKPDESAEISDISINCKSTFATYRSLASRAAFIPSSGGGYDAVEMVVPKQQSVFNDDKIGNVTSIASVKGGK
jgi:hypothetical protein